MRALILAALLAPCFAFAAGGTKPTPRDGVISFPQPITTKAHADARAAATSEAVGGTGGNVAIHTNSRGAVVAPDIASYPSAECAVTGGVSGGWIGGAFGISGTTIDEGCDIREFSRLLHEQGNRRAATQILCLNDRARLALQATGTVCLIGATTSPPPVEIKP